MVLRYSDKKERLQYAFNKERFRLSLSDWTGLMDQNATMASKDKPTNNTGI